MFAFNPSITAESSLQLLGKDIWPSPSPLPETAHPGRHIPDPRDGAHCSVKHETCWLRLIRLTRFTSDQLSGWRGGAGCYDVSTSYSTIACNVGVQPGVEMTGYGRQRPA